MNKKDKYRLKGLSTKDLEEEYTTIVSIINDFPYIEPPDAILRVKDINIPNLKQKEKIERLIDIFIRLNQYALITNLDYRDIYKKKIIKFTVNETIIERYEKLLKNELQHRKSIIDKSFCRLENNTFFITLNNLTEEAINFSDRRGNNNLIDLFEVFYKHWLSFGKLEDGWISTSLTKEQIIIELSKKGRSNITNDWIKNTKNNILNQKIKSLQLEGYISLEYDSVNDGYCLKIKKP